MSLISIMLYMADLLFFLLAASSLLNSSSLMKSLQGLVRSSGLRSLEEQVSCVSPFESQESEHGLRSRGIITSQEFSTSMSRLDRRNYWRQLSYASSGIQSLLLGAWERNTFSCPTLILYGIRWEQSLDIPRPMRTLNITKLLLNLIRAEVRGVSLASSLHAIIKPVSPASHCSTATQNLPSGGWETKLLQIFPARSIL